MPEIFSKIKLYSKRFFAFLREDSWQSLIVLMILAYIFIKFIFFPVLSSITGATPALFIVESCSMYHSEDLEAVMQNPIYEDYNLSLEDTENWPFKKGLNKGDIVLLVSHENAKIGDVIVFN